MRSSTLAWLWVGCLWNVLGETSPPAAAPLPTAPPARARVVVVHEPAATDNYLPVSNVVASVVSHGITALTGQATTEAAWRSLVTTQDTVGIKVYAKPGPVVGTRLPVAEAVVRGLQSAGLPGRQIVVWDRHLADLRQAGFVDLASRCGVRVASSVEAGWDESIFYESSLLGQLVAGDHEFGKQGPKVGRRSFGSRLVRGQITKIISVAPLLNHNQLGVSGHLLGMGLASVDNVLRFENSLNFLTEAVPDILALPELGVADHWVVSITDALLGQYQGEDRQLLHYSVALNELWFSRDPVALDVLGVHELENQRQASGAAKRRLNLELYENAELVWLGVSKLARIDVVRLGDLRPAGAVIPAPVTNTPPPANGPPRG